MSFGREIYLTPWVHGNSQTAILFLSAQLPPQHENSVRQCCFCAQNGKTNTQFNFQRTQNLSFQSQTSSNYKIIQQVWAKKS